MNDSFAIAIVGAGPAGLSAAGRAAECGLEHVLLEASEHIADTTYKYQKGKLVMATPAALPLRSALPFQAGTREHVLEAWQSSAEALGINLRLGSTLQGIAREADGFHLALGGDRHLTCQNVVLAIGLQGNIRRLAIPGAEHSPLVQYQLDDPEAFEDQRIVVVGAGDAAIENALALSLHNQVTIVNRRDEFARAKSGNLQAIMAAIEGGRIDCYFNATPTRISDTDISLRTPAGEATIACDRVIARLGATPPRDFLERCGVHFPTTDPNALPQVTTRYESNVPGLYIIGALSGYPLIKQAMNQGFEVIEHIRGNRDIRPADESILQARFDAIEAGAVSEVLERIQSRIPLFANLNPLVLRELMLDSAFHRLEPGAVIFERNDYSTSFYSILDGEVEITPDPDTRLTLETGEYFGEMGLISGRRRSATAHAGAAGATLVETNRRAMVKLINTENDVKRVLDDTTVVRHIQTYLAPHLAKQALAEVVKASSIHAHDLDQVLFSEGDPGDSLHLIRKGSVTISKRIAEREVVLGYVAAGNYVGEMALVSDTPRSATVRAAANGTETIRIEGEAVKALLEQSPRLRRDVEDKFRERISRNESLSAQPEASSVIEFLLQQGLGEATDVLIIDESICIRCDNCERACAGTHQGVSRLDRESGPRYANLHVPTSCRHCEHPYCMSDCPPDAIHRSQSGEVYVNDACIGCGNCVRNCPYGVIQLAAPRAGPSGFLSRLLGSWNGQRRAGNEESQAKLAVKCDMCTGLTGGPACVRACPTGAAARVRPEDFFALVART